MDFFLKKKMSIYSMALICLNYREYRGLLLCTHPPLSFYLFVAFLLSDCYILVIAYIVIWNFSRGIFWVWVLFFLSVLIHFCCYYYWFVPVALDRWWCLGWYAGIVLLSLLEGSWGDRFVFSPYIYRIANVRVFYKCLYKYNSWHTRFPDSNATRKLWRSLSRGLFVCGGWGGGGCCFFMLQLLFFSIRMFLIHLLGSTAAPPRL